MTRPKLFLVDFLDFFNKIWSIRVNRGKSGEKKLSVKNFFFPKNVDMVPNNYHRAYGSTSTSQNGVTDLFVHTQKKKTLVPCPVLPVIVKNRVWRGVKTGVNYPTHVLKHVSD